MNRSCKLVHQAIATLFDGKPVSVKHLAELTYLSERTVRRCIHTLVGAGYITRQRAAYNQPSIYRVLIPPDNNTIATFSLILGGKSCSPDPAESCS